MALSTDLRIRGQFRPLPVRSASTGGGSFSQVLSTTYQDIGGGDYESIFQAAASAYQVPVNLLKAMAKAESNFNANAVSSCGAQGIMQLMPATARSLGVADSFDPAQNIMGGAKYLRQMLDRFGGDTSLAVAAYNAGPNAVKKYGGIPPYRETQNYVAKVLGYAGSDITVPSAAPEKLTASTVSSAPVPSPVSLEEMKESLQSAMRQVYRANGVRKAAQLYVEQLRRKEEDEQAGTVSL